MNEVVHTSPTIGSNVEEIVVNNTHFLMWDIGGQESLRSSWNTYYTNTEVIEGIRWVASLLQSFKVSQKEWIEMINEEWMSLTDCSLFLSISLDQFVIVVVDSTDRERISVTKEELYRMLAHEVSMMRDVC